MPILIYPYRHHGWKAHCCKLAGAGLSALSVAIAIKTDASGWLLALCILGFVSGVVFIVDGLKGLVRYRSRIYADARLVEYGALAHRRARWEDVVDVRLERLLHVTNLNPERFQLNLIIETRRGGELAIPLFDTLGSFSADYDALVSLVEEKTGVEKGGLAAEALGADQAGRDAAVEYLARPGNTLIMVVGVLAISYLTASTITTLEKPLLFALVFVPLFAVLVWLVLLFRRAVERNRKGKDHQ